MTVFDGKLFFSVDPDGQDNRELWSFDGAVPNMEARFNTAPGAFTDMIEFAIYAY